MAEHSYMVTGMTCAHCAASVSEEIGEISGVSDVRVDLPTGAVTVISTGRLDDALVLATVEEAGYRLAG